MNQHSIDSKGKDWNLELSKETKEKVFKDFSAWRARKNPAARETSLSDWNIGRYKEVFIIARSGGRRGNCLYFVKDDKCVEFSPAFEDIDSIYQAFLKDEEPEKS